MSDALADLLSAPCKHCGAEPREVTVHGVEYPAVRVHRSLGCPGVEMDGLLLGHMFAINVPRDTGPSPLDYVRNTGQEAGQ